MTQDEHDLVLKLRQLLDYDQNTGRFTWKPRQGAPDKWRYRYENRPTMISKARGGGLCGVIDGKPIAAHVAAWAIRHGEIRCDLFHWNHDKNDNRIMNIRAHGLLGSSKGFPAYFASQLTASGHDM